MVSRERLGWVFLSSYTLSSVTGEITASPEAANRKMKITRSRLGGSVRKEGREKRRAREKGAKLILGICFGPHTKSREMKKR
ncbi:hypothetical protein MRB53_002601 [Persea americana]|uniref:Uncharacterized protein n=1 Tax=Persea americana TaxID=3435 RepID=A0ACC2MVP3_PERAE|nr:hypothetical protein MRB53_002601 [Persea americana]